jgi:hypothetical protein
MPSPPAIRAGVVPCKYIKPLIRREGTLGTGKTGPAPMSKDVGVACLACGEVASVGAPSEVAVGTCVAAEVAGPVRLSMGETFLFVPLSVTREDRIQARRAKVVGESVPLLDEVGKRARLMTSVALLQHAVPIRRPRLQRTLLRPCSISLDSM